MKSLKYVIQKLMVHSIVGQIYYEFNELNLILMPFIIDKEILGCKY